MVKTTTSRMEYSTRLESTVKKKIGGGWHKTYWSDRWWKRGGRNKNLRRPAYIVNLHWQLEKQKSQIKLWKKKTKTQQRSVEENS